MTQKTYPPDANDHRDVETYTYDANGNRLTKTVGGVTTTYTYDAMNRVLSETPSGTGAGTESIHYTYQGGGGRLSKKEIKRGTDVVRSIAFTYDLRGRIQTQSTPEGAGAFPDTLAFGYDAAGNRTSVTAPAPYGTVTTDYDELNRPKDVHVPGVSGTVHVAYDPNGNRASIAYPNGVTTSYQYNEQNRLMLLEHTTASSTIASYTYTLGPSGNRTDVEEQPSGRTIHWDYDDLYRLTGEAITDSVNGNRTQGFTYDDVGNRLERTDSTLSGPTAYAYDNADHLTSITPDGEAEQLQSWDESGRLTLRGATPLVWNPWDRLVKKDDGSATTFGYSPDGIVRTKQWVTSSPQTTQKRRYVYDRTLPYAQMLQEWDNTGNAVMADYLYLDGDLIGYKDERSGVAARYWVLKDGQNSVRKVVDASASVVASYDYDAFGNALAQTQPSGWIFNHRAFGEVWDPQLEMTYLRARWMDPGTGRFESRDEFAGSSDGPGTLHKYVYANQDPINLLDPSGYFTCHSPFNAYALTLLDFSKEAIEVVNDGDSHVDRVWNQTNNPEHSMRNMLPIPQTTDEARIARDAFVRQKFELVLSLAAFESASDDDIKSALYAMGEMLHPLQDEVAHNWIFLIEHANPAVILSDNDPSQEAITSTRILTETYSEEVLNAIHLFGGATAAYNFKRWPQRKAGFETSLLSVSGGIANVAQLTDVALLSGLTSR